MAPSRRDILAGTASGGLLIGHRIENEVFDDAWHQGVVERYFSLGDKASGGPGDMASGAWLEDELIRVGYTCRRQFFSVPWYDAAEASLSVDGVTATILPHALVVPTGPNGLTAPLSLALGEGSLEGSIALIVLPSRRWSSSADPLIIAALADVWVRGAAAAVLVTTGPTGDALALNAVAERDASPRPVAILAPRDAGAFLDAAADGRAGRLVISGQGGERPAYNLTASLARGGGKSVVLSTPRSGWFGCAGERGSGIAVWLAAATWLARRPGAFDIELVATSGHEYENLGGARYLEDAAPSPDRTRLWVHVGANLAARDWHELGPRLRPLPGVDSQRYLLASPDVFDAFCRGFARLPGQEAVYPATAANAAGELTNIIAAGYGSAAGFFGNHRFHHSRNDDLRCVSGELVRPASEALRATLLDILAV